MHNKSILYTVAGVIAVVVLGGIIATGFSENKKVSDQKKADDTAMMKKKDDDKMAMEKDKMGKDVMMKKDSESDKMVKDVDTMKKDDAAMMKKDAEVMTKTPEVMLKPTEVMAKKGEYKPYSVDELSFAKDGNHVVIFFNASWCPTCQSTVKNINSNMDSISSNLHILSADYDKETSLKQKYGVTTQHTFVEVDASGNLIKKASGLSTVDAINNFIK
jgi:thiol-disulfide isomerase/thioredoxin